MEPAWNKEGIEGTDEIVQRLTADLVEEDYLELRERIQAPDQVSAVELTQAAHLFRAIAQVVIAYARAHEDKELVPAWPYIATKANGQAHFLIADGVSKSELGNRAFVRDGRRALRTVEVPIYEANLWRVGIAITDYLGLHDDVAKFSSVESDVEIDAEALANPARYILRTQLWKLRGAYADSQIGRRPGNEKMLPDSVERSLRLLETFPEASDDSVHQIIHVLATESESAAMYLAFRERWECADIASFLKALTNRVLSRLPLSIGKELAADAVGAKKLRRDLAGILVFARRVFSITAESQVATLPAWRALCAGIICTGISIAIEGLVASLRSHGAFERYSTFDFPSDWDIPAAVPQTEAEGAFNPASTNQIHRISLVEQLRSLLQRLGHRMSRDGISQDKLSEELFDQLRYISRVVAAVESQEDEAVSAFDWPFTLLSNLSLEPLNLDLLERVASVARQLDSELALEVVFVQGQTYGFNAQTRRFTDSKSGVWDVTPWMITKFPPRAKHLEEISHEGRFLRIWSEVFDRHTGKLLSVSALGEPFASISVKKPVMDTVEALVNQGPNSFANISATVVPPIIPALQESLGSRNISNEVSAGQNALPIELNKNNAGNISGAIAAITSGSSTTISLAVDEPPARTGATTHGEAYEFRKRQLQEWSRRGGESYKHEGHIRIALLQADMGITYKHPFVEACPLSWPFSPDIKDQLAEKLKTDPIYGPLLNATAKPELGHFWEGRPDEIKDLPSWSEHRRQRILRRVIDSCEELKVDLLVLPEYSVRRETVEWLKDYLRNKGVAVLAGTYMDFRPEPALKSLTAQLTLLWPVPKEIAERSDAVLQSNNEARQEPADFLMRGMVLEFSRSKKYRSIALEEFFRPSPIPLRPLFIRGNLVKAIEKEMESMAFTGAKRIPSMESINHLLTQTRLPLQHLLELICSEIFLVSSPANYLDMNEDYKTMMRRFGVGGEEEEVFNDVKALSRLLNITGNGIDSRRSILVVPAATSRSADYWIAGQASFLAAGTTSVFCNAIGSKELVGGSCFIGCGSWKSVVGKTGYISKITPYHGWSKGIYFNSSNDALSDKDQAVVIADIDPHNMLEGKPRSQTMPAPLQLVAYLPLVESINWACSEANLLKALPGPLAFERSVQCEKAQMRDEEKFWGLVRKASTTFDKKSLENLWEEFPDKEPLLLRAKACSDNGNMQPTAAHGAKGMFAAPAYYDWIDVSLTLTEQEALPRIAVPPWKLKGD